jgi:hypothetical protein
MFDATIPLESLIPNTGHQIPKQLQYPTQVLLTYILIVVSVIFRVTIAPSDDKYRNSLNETANFTLKIQLNEHPIIPHLFSTLRSSSLPTSPECTLSICTLKFSLLPPLISCLHRGHASGFLCERMCFRSFSCRARSSRAATCLPPFTLAPRHPSHPQGMRSGA